MIKFYYHPTPNSYKVALFLEEASVPYEGVLVDTHRGQQFTEEFIAINPNSKVPAIMDGDVRVFDSNAILLYLAEKTGQFLPENTLKSRGDLLSWLMFVASGLGPFVGQAGHFRHAAPKGLDYPVKRYCYEARRHFAVLDGQLSTKQFLLGDAYTIVDMAAWGWTRALTFVLGEEAWGTVPNVKRWFDEITARPAAARAAAFLAQHKPIPDDEGRRNLFRYAAPQTT